MKLHERLAETQQALKACMRLHVEPPKSLVKYHNLLLQLQIDRRKSALTSSEHKKLLKAAKRAARKRGVE